MPAIGASTTGDSMTCRPMRSGGSTGAWLAAGVDDVVRVLMTAPLSPA